MTDAPSVAPAPVVMDLPSSGSSNRAPSSEPIPVLPTGTSTEEAVVIAQVPGAFNRQLDDDANPNISAKTKAQRRRERYRRGGMYGGLAQREQQAADRAAHKTVLEKYGDDGRASESTDDAQRERAERGLRQEETQHEEPQQEEQQQEQPEDDAAQPEQYDEEYARAPASPEAQEAALREIHKQMVDEVSESAVFVHKCQQTGRPDFLEVVAPIIPDLNELSPAKLKALKQSEFAGHIVYAFGASVEGLQNLTKYQSLSDHDALKQMGRWEHEFEQAFFPSTHNAPRSQSHQPQRRVATQAPRPITPLRGSASPPSQLGTVNNYIKKLYGDRG